MSDMRVNLCGVELKNPVIAASGTFGYGMEYNEFYPVSTLGGISCKGTTLRERQGNLSPRIAETPSGMLNSVGLQNPGVEMFLSTYLPWLKGQGTAVIANIAGHSLEEYGEMAERLRDSAVDLIELNISCPNVKEGGVLFGQDPALAAQVTAAVRRAAPGKHVMVKLSPNVTDIALMARSVEDAGADSISCINTLLGMSVDLNSRKPSLANVVGGLSGPAIKPVALRCVWQVARAVNIPVIGIGGIVTAEDALEFLLVGARAVQVGTGNFMRPDCAFALAEELPALCEKLGIEDLGAYCGSLDLD